ncbi:replication protein A 70 kDa DNA-binding subunit B [Tanacetum coccineum]
MEHNMTQLCDLDRMLDDAKILTRVISIWKSHKKRYNEVWSLDEDTGTCDRDGLPASYYEAAARFQSSGQIRSSVVSSSQGCDRFSPPFGRRGYHTEYDVRDETETIKPICERREEDENCYLFLHMPGLNKGDVKSKIEGLRYYRLTIEGHKMQEDYKCIKYKDSFNINGSGTIVGKMEDGELTITLPKMKEGEEGNECRLEIN